MSSLYKTKIWIFLAVLVGTSYLPLLGNFFQQDEWYAFGEMIGNSDIPLRDQVVSFFAFNSGHYVPLHNILALLFYNIFQFNFQYWALVSIVWHIINVLLVYKFICYCTSDKTIALLVSFLFGLSASSSQATTWIGANISSHGATSLGIISMYFFWKVLSEKSSEKVSRNLLYSIFFWILSLLFKEITLGLIPLFVIMILVYKVKEKSKTALAYSLVGLFYLGFRIVTIFNSDNTNQIATSTQSKVQILYNIFTFPFKVFSQVIIPQNIFIFIGNFLARLLPERLKPAYGTTEFDIFAQNVVMEMFSIVFFIICLYMFYLVYQNHKKIRKLISYSFVFGVFNSFIYALSPERYGKIVIMDSRNLYFPSIGIFLFLVLAVFKGFKNTKLAILLLVSLVIVNLISLQSILMRHSNDAHDRKYILSSIHLPETESNRTIVYTESNSSYFGLHENEKILPFQSGFGQTALVYYYKELKLPKEFYSSHFLWDIKSQGYTEYRGKGFGYFRDFDMLQEAVNTYTIVPNEIYAYRWDSATHSLKEISNEVRERLKYEKNS